MEFYLADLETQRGRDIISAKLLAIMTMLRDDEVEQLIRRWQAVTAVNGGGRIVKAAERDPNDDLVEQYKQQHGGSVKAEPSVTLEDAPNVAATVEEPAPSTPTMPEDDAGGFELQGYTFSPLRRGPSAALKRALTMLETCTNVLQVNAMQQHLDRLEGWLRGISQDERADTLASMIESRRKELTAPSEAAEAPEAEEEAPWEEPTSGNGAAPEPELSVRDLLNKAMDLLGRGKVSEVMARHGAKRVVDIKDEVEAAVRADLAELMGDLAALEEDLHA